MAMRSLLRWWRPRREAGPGTPRPCLRRPTVDELESRLLPDAGAWRVVLQAPALTTSTSPTVTALVVGPAGAKNVQVHIDMDFNHDGQFANVPKDSGGPDPVGPVPHPAQPPM